MSTDSTNFTAQGFLGRTPEGERVYVEIRVETRLCPATTVRHEPVTSVTRLAITGHWFRKGARGVDYDGGGQCVDMVAAVTRPEPEFSRDDITRLVEIWRRWHLNDMRAGCAHQGEPVYREGRYGREVDLANTPACPETGYRFGHAWLYEEPPAEVLTELRAFADNLDGTDGLR